VEAATKICGSNLGGQGEIGITQQDKDQTHDFWESDQRRKNRWDFYL